MSAGNGVQAIAPSTNSSTESKLLMAQFERDLDDDEGSDGVTPFSANSDSKTNSNDAPNHARLQSRRSSVLSEIGAMVAPVSTEHLMEKVKERNEENSKSAMSRLAYFMKSKKDAMLNIFGRGEKKVDQVYHRGSLPMDAGCLIIDPKSPKLRRWDLYIMVLLIWTAVITPYEVAFTEPKLNVLFFINRLIDLSFGIDIVMNFLTARFDDDTGRWSYTFGSIACIYLQGWFTIDFVSVLPFDLLGIVFDSDAFQQLRILRVVRLMRLLKLARILRASRIFRRWENQINLSYSVMSLIKFMLAVTTISHWMACAWRIVVDIEDIGNAGAVVQPINWVVDAGMDSHHHFQQYIAALYWSVMTITTIGYGDLSAVTDGERVLATICMLLGASIYAYVVGAVCGIVSGLDEATSKFHQTMDQLNSYMSEYRIPKPLRETLREYFRHCRVLSRERHYQDLLKQMSPDLRGQVAVFCHSAWILKVPFFNAPTVGDEERESFVVKVATAIEPLAFAPNEAIIRVNQPARQMYIIQKGVVAKSGAILGSGQFFGEDVILKNYSRPYSVRTLTYVDVFQLTKAKLQDIIQHDEYPATRAAIRRAAIALAFRIRFIALSKALGSARLFQATPVHNGLASMMSPSNARSASTAAAAGGSGAVPILHPNPLGGSPDAGAGAGAGAGASSSGAGTSGADTAMGTEPALSSDVEFEGEVHAHASPAAMHSSGSYKQLAPPNSQRAWNGVAQLVTSKHNQVVEAMTKQFAELQSQMRAMSERIDELQGMHKATRRRGCC